MGSDVISISVEFTFDPCHTRYSITDYRSGGLEMLFSNERKHTVTLPARLSDGSSPNISYLLQYLVDNVMRDERKELFILEDNVYATSYQRKQC